MTEEPLEPLSPELRKLLDAAPARTLGPAKAALLSRLQASAAASGAAGVAAGVGTAKVVAIALAAAVAGAGGGIAIDRVVFPPEPKIVERVVVKTVTVEVPTAPEPSREAPPAPPPAPAPVKPSRPAPRPTANEERPLIEAARTALIKRDAAAALVALGAHRQRFPDGQNAEERDSLEVQALLQAGRFDEAKQQARAFIATYPESIFGPSVEAALRQQ